MSLVPMVHHPSLFLYLLLLNLCLYSPPSCSFCTTSYDIQAVSIFQCILSLSEIRHKLLDTGLSPFFLPWGSHLLFENANTVNFEMYALMPAGLQ